MTDPKKTDKTFSKEERDAIKDRAKEVKAAAGKEEAARSHVAKIAEMKEPDRTIATRIDALVAAAAPGLDFTLWYGMPAYARDGKIICFFQDAAKFKTRYSTLGFNEAANLDDGEMWPVAYAVQKLSATDEDRIKALVKKAAG